MENCRKGKRAGGTFALPTAAAMPRGQPQEASDLSLAELRRATGGFEAVLFAPLASQPLDITTFLALSVQVSPSFNSTDGGQYPTDNINHAGLCPNASLITGDSSLGLLYFTLA